MYNYITLKLRLELLSQYAERFQKVSLGLTITSGGIPTLKTLIPISTYTSISIFLSVIIDAIIVPLTYDVAVSFTPSDVLLARRSPKEGGADTRPLVVAVSIKCCSFQSAVVHHAAAIVALAKDDRDVPYGGCITAVIGSKLERTVWKWC